MAGAFVGVAREQWLAEALIYELASGKPMPQAKPAKWGATMFGFRARR
jgi:hypothetical protein